MIKKCFWRKLAGCGMICAIILAGCGNGSVIGKERDLFENEQTGESGFRENEEVKEPETETEDFPEEAGSEPETAEPGTAESGTMASGTAEPETAEPGTMASGTAEPGTIEADWSEYFDGIEGAAVIYDVSAMQFTVYNSALAETRRSPCSTFKIVSSLIALENGIIVPEDSTRKWSGEVFWNENWNCDIDFNQAFHESCVWYFREVIDEIGQERMQEELDRLSYGNCDISDWEGRLNTNNTNRALTGFWLESSLAISPKEQTEVMERIFGENSFYPETVRNELREVMLVEFPGEADISVYGKTGMGKTDGITVDAWFSGFAETSGGNIYYCVYLGRTDDKNVTSTAAKEIAIRLVSDYCNKEDRESY